jgi:MFS family permease
MRLSSEHRAQRSGPRLFSWLGERVPRCALLTEQRWLALWAAMLGYMLDAMDVLLYVFAIQTLRAEFHWSAATAGVVSSVTLVASSFGGIAAGMLADRIGRSRALIYTILVYSIGSAGSASSTGLISLFFWRAVVGLGLGGEWSAGSVLVSEHWPAEHRAKAIGLTQSGWAIGYMLAAVVTALVLPRFGWRALFLVGVLPALLTIWIQRKVKEPEIWTRKQATPGALAMLFRLPLRRITILATSLATSVLFAYWGVNTWLPGFLSAPRSQGGAGLNIVQTSAWIFIMQIGAFLGYVTFGLMADRFGRRPAFAVYVLVAAILTPIYGLIPRWAGASSETWLLIIGPAVGFFGTGFFSLFGAMLAELYPTAVRGTGQGFVYNFGRAVSAFAPFAVGSIADRQGIGAGLALSAAFFLVGAVLIFTLPETRNMELK